MNAVAYPHHLFPSPFPGTAFRLNSTPLTVNMPDVEDAAELWKQNPELSAGLHLCVTAGSPLTRPGSLMNPDGAFDKSVRAYLRQKSGYSEEGQPLFAHRSHPFHLFISLL
ncbi:ChbG/HpnK family deacetylase [Faecalibaculum rodentium]|uniref:ChbG/HpnK family deacetylase n=1 Tax=Faecalibaculum rodentium TaxID=1702221 RepID=UPI0023F31E15|nr:ChbG/HpnK family deacetylase [Faecalibaculum rodentium]